MKPKELRGDRLRSQQINKLKALTRNLQAQIKELHRFAAGKANPHDGDGQEEWYHLEKPRANLRALQSKAEVLMGRRKNEPP